MKLMSRRIALPALVLVAALPLLAADGLAVKLGLWETTSVTATSGMSMPAMPPEAMANMAPAQRAQMEAMMKQMGGSGPHAVTDKSCVTEKDLKEGAFRQPREDTASKCKYTPVTATGRHQEWAFQCSMPGGGATGKMIVDAVDSSHVRGTFDMKAPNMTINTKFESKWLSSSCAGQDKD